MLILNKNSETVKPEALLRQDKAARGVSYGIIRNPGAPVNSDLWARAELFDAAMVARARVAAPELSAALIAVPHTYGTPERLFEAALGAGVQAISAEHHGIDAAFVNISFVGSDALAKELGPAGAGVAITQVVPFPRDHREGRIDL